MFVFNKKYRLSPDEGYPAFLSEQQQFSRFAIISGFGAIEIYAASNCLTGVVFTVPQDFVVIAVLTNIHQSSDFLTYLMEIFRLTC